jgi:hypothetical protein
MRSKDTTGADASVCAGVENFTGVCDTDDPEFAWFCMDGALYLLDCVEFGDNFTCAEDGQGTWDCVDTGTMP